MRRGGEIHFPASNSGWLRARSLHLPTSRRLRVGTLMSCYSNETAPNISRSNTSINRAQELVRLARGTSSNDFLERLEEVERKTSPQSRHASRSPPSRADTQLLVQAKLAAAAAAKRSAHRAELVSHAVWDTSASHRRVQRERAPKTFTEQMLDIDQSSSQVVAADPSDEAAERLRRAAAQFDRQGVSLELRSADYRKAERKRIASMSSSIDGEHGASFGDTALNLTNDLVENAKSLSSTATSLVKVARTGLRGAAEDLSYMAEGVLHKAQDAALDAKEASGLLNQVKSASDAAVAGATQVRHQSAARNSRAAVWKVGLLTDAFQ
jgi:hypothetical protein